MQCWDLVKTNVIVYISWCQDFTGVIASPSTYPCQFTISPPLLTAASYNSSCQSKRSPDKHACRICQTYKITTNTETLAMLSNKAYRLEMDFLRLAMMQKRKEEQDLEECWSLPSIGFSLFQWVSWSPSQLCRNIYQLIGTSLDLWRLLGVMFPFLPFSQFCQFFTFKFLDKMYNSDNLFNLFDSL